jgi:hypothetical protein
MCGHSLCCTSGEQGRISVMDAGPGCCARMTCSCCCRPSAASYPPAGLPAACRLPTCCSWPPWCCCCSLLPSCSMNIAAAVGSTSSQRRAPGSRKASDSVAAQDQESAPDAPSAASTSAAAAVLLLAALPGAAPRPAATGPLLSSTSLLRAMLGQLATCGAPLHVPCRLLAAGGGGGGGTSNARAALLSGVLLAPPSADTAVAEPSPALCCLWCCLPVGSSTTVLPAGLLAADWNQLLNQPAAPALGEVTCCWPQGPAGPAAGLHAAPVLEVLDAGALGSIWSEACWASTAAGSGKAADSTSIAGPVAAASGA